MAKAMVYIPTLEEKKKAREICYQIIDILKPYPLEFRAFVLQMLIESFDDIYHIDLKRSISINEGDEEKKN